jgi:hypothetical protein
VSAVILELSARKGVISGKDAALTQTQREAMISGCYVLLRNTLNRVQRERGRITIERDRY